MLNSLSNLVKTVSIGTKAEARAKAFLLEQGLTFVKNNYRCRLGEIDLIFKDHQTLIFVEVKYRGSHQFGHANEMVTIQKQRKIIKAASTYLQENKLTEAVSARFDVIAIEPPSKVAGNLPDSSLSIQWIKNAFQAH